MSFSLDSNLEEALNTSLDIQDPYYGWYKDSSMTEFVQSIKDLSLDINNTAKLYAKRAEGFTITEKETSYPDNTHSKMNVVLERVDLTKTPDEVNLKQVYFKGKKITEIGEKAFVEPTRLKSILLPETLTGIQPKAFDGASSLTSIVIPESVTFIGTNAFNGCFNLTVHCEATDSSPYWYNSWDGDDVGINQTVTTRTVIFDSEGKIATFKDFRYSYNPRGSITIIGYDGNQAEVEIPETIDNLKVIGLGYRSFINNKTLKTIKLPETITYLGNECFKQCTITSIALPKSVTSIGNYAFNYTDLASIVLNEGLKEIGSFAFKNAEIASITIPEGITEIKPYTFDSCKPLVDITLPQSLTRAIA